MIAVVFEVWPRHDRRDTYLDLAAALRDELEEIAGFISIERFESLSQPGKLLSLSFWRDEEAVTVWRNQRSHRAAQRAGRDDVFSDYRLRIAAVTRDYGMADRAQVPDDSKVSLRCASNHRGDAATSRRRPRRRRLRAGRS